MKKGPVEEVRAGEEDLFQNPYTKVDEIVEKRRRNLEKRKVCYISFS